jgi:hypothetical protein
VVCKPETDEFFERVRMRCGEIGDLILGQVRTVSSLQDMYKHKDLETYFRCLERINHGVLVCGLSAMRRSKTRWPCRQQGDLGSIPISEEWRPKSVSLRLSCHCTVNGGHGARGEA